MANSFDYSCIPKVFSLGCSNLLLLPVENVWRQFSRSVGDSSGASRHFPSLHTSKEFVLIQMDTIIRASKPIFLKCFWACLACKQRQQTLKK